MNEQIEGLELKRAKLVEELNEVEREAFVLRQKVEELTEAIIDASRFRRKA